MTFRTELSLEPSKNQIRYQSSIFSIGSCFSTSIGQKMADLQYNIVQNPAGITFNPISISSTIRACISKDSLPEHKLFFHNGLWSHPDFHGSYNHPNKQSYLSYTQSSLNVASHHLENVQYVFITVGTAYVFVDKKNDEVVNNCHKRPSNDFDRRLLSIKEITESLSSSIKMIDKYSAQSVQYIITVSPVRHIRDGLVENLLSKSRLIEAVHQITKTHENASYFPAYEILMDDLRDYRFYQSDLIHPSDSAVDYIYSQFASVWLAQDEQAIRDSVTNINKDLSHRPLFPESKAHEKFQYSLSQKMNDLMSKYDFIDFKDQLEQIENTKINAGH